MTQKVRVFSGKNLPGAPGGLFKEPAPQGFSPNEFSQGGVQRPSQDIFVKRGGVAEAYALYPKRKGLRPEEPGGSPGYRILQGEWGILSPGHPGGQEGVPEHQTRIEPQVHSRTPGQGSEFVEIFQASSEGLSGQTDHHLASQRESLQKQKFQGFQNLPAGISPTVFPECRVFQRSDSQFYLGERVFPKLRRHGGGYAEGMGGKAQHTSPGSLSEGLQIGPAFFPGKTCKASSEIADFQGGFLPFQKSPNLFGRGGRFSGDALLVAVAAPSGAALHGKKKGKSFHGETVVSLLFMVSGRAFS
jgi:hypothetical protein